MRKRNHIDENSRYLTIDQLANRLNIGRSMARRVAIQAGAIRNIGNCTRVDTMQIDDYIARECATEKQGGNYC